MIDFDHQREWISSPDYVYGEAYGFALTGYWEPGHTHGYNVWVTAPVEVTHVGMYDRGLDGLNGDVTVGIWSHDPTLPSAPAELLDTFSLARDGDLRGAWRTTEAGPFWLMPGVYTIGAVYDPPPPGESHVTPDQFLWNLDEGGYVQAVTDERINIDFSSPILSGFPGTAPSTPGILSLPDVAYLIIGAMVGPTLFIAPVPEPHAFGLLMSALGLAAGASRRMSRR